jgi:predicted PurR-regulated permease PerM
MALHCLKKEAMRSNPDPWLRALYPPLVLLAWLAVLVIGGWLLTYLTKTLLMLMLSGVLAFALTPLVNLLSRRLPRVLAIGAAYVLGVGVVLGLGALLVMTAASQVLTLVTNLPYYAEQAQAVEPQLEVLLTPFGIPARSIADAQQHALMEVQAIGTNVATESLGWVTQIAGALIDVVLVLLLSIYLTANGPEITGLVRRGAPARPRHRADFLIVIVKRGGGGYIRGTATLAALIGVLVGVGLWLMGIPYAVMLGGLTFFMEFIPVLGVFVAGTAAVLVALFVGWERALLVLGYFALVHIIEADVVGPRIMGRAVGIHPATGLIALFAGTELFGLWGALFAAPLAGLLQAIGTATWLELRGGDPQGMMQAVVDREQEKVEQHVGLELPKGAPPAEPTGHTRL